MNKIGIITRHCYPNYGSILQSYALETAFRKLGADVRVIDYVQNGDQPLGLVNSTLRVSHMRHSLFKRIIYRLVQTPTFVSMAVTFRRHQRRLLTLTEEIDNSEDLRLIGNDFDLIVTGSDQVWNRITGYLDANYFLDFVDNREKKASYAASLGAEKPREEDAEDFLSYVKKISRISVREPSSQKWLNTNGVAAREDVDPVILHGKDFWCKFAGERKYKKTPYILVYQLHSTPGFSARLHEIKKKHSLPIIRVTPDWKHLIRPGKTKILISPENFVGLIRDASYVVTDSFHGTAFALRLGTPLYVMPPSKYATRLRDMLTRVNLERLVMPWSLDEINTVSPEYDAANVDQLLAKQAEGSWDYLKTLVDRCA